MLLFISSRILFLKEIYFWEDKFSICFLQISIYLSAVYILSLLLWSLGGYLLSHLFFLSRDYFLSLLVFLSGDCVLSLLVFLSGDNVLFPLFYDWFLATRSKSFLVVYFIFCYILLIGVLSFWGRFFRLRCDLGVFLSATMCVVFNVLLMVRSGSHILNTQQVCKVFEKSILKFSSLIMQ